MLILQVRNVYTDDQDIADYFFQLNINLTPIAVGSVLAHYRPLGAAALLRRVADEMDSWNTKGLDAVGVGGEEENPDIREAEKAPTSNPSPGGTSGAGA